MADGVFLPPPAQTPVEAVSALLRRLQIVRGADEKAALLAVLTTPQRPVRLAFLNQHGVNLACDDPQFRADLMGCDVLLRDGIGLKAALRAAGVPAGLNLNGSDLIPQLLKAWPEARVAWFGTRNPWLMQAALKAESAYRVRPARMLDGFQPPSAYVTAAQESTPHMIVLGMGMPKQERVATRLAAGLDHPCLIICGGAIIDFLAGKVRRAPAPLRVAGLEWAYRLAQEPDRLWSRYGPGGVQFAKRAQALRQALRAEKAARR
jgi:exopolysaccharide biosynthesis WecB/TagA/CpsF family protein